MKMRVSIIAIVGMVFLAATAFCQQEKAQVEQPIPEIGQEAENSSWVWGEVKSVDTAATSLDVIYMDYQTDEEKELLLATDTQTRYEGAKDLNEIKAGDTASIDYVIQDGKNIARNISIEKIEAMPEAPIEPEDMPQEPIQEPVSE